MTDGRGKPMNQRQRDELDARLRARALNLRTADQAGTRTTTNMPTPAQLQFQERLRETMLANPLVSEIDLSTPSAPETAGEWRTGRADSLMDRRRVYDGEGRVVANANSDDDAVQIVADHHAAQTQAGLVEALDAAAEQIVFLEQALEEYHGTRAPNPALAQARAALKAAGGR